MTFRLFTVLVPLLASCSYIVCQQPIISTTARNLCGQSVLREGQLSSQSKLRLGKSVNFDDGIGINAGRCYPLYNGERLLAWIDSYHKVGSRVFVRRCVEDSAIKDIEPGSKGGAVADAIDELQLKSDDRRPKFVQLDPPFWSEFANPSFCDKYLAYWGMEFKEQEPVKVFAVVFDLTDRQVLRQELLGSVQLESDSRSFFARPLWVAAHKSVTFEPGPSGEAPVGSRLKSITIQLK